MYYKNGVFAGAGTYPTAGNDGDFGLDAYEPEFFIRKEDWLATKYSVALTLTDTTYATDIFYFCHIHAGMSGYIKIADASGTVVSTTGTYILWDAGPTLVYFLPSNRSWPTITICGFPCFEGTIRRRTVMLFTNDTHHTRTCA